MPRQITDGNGLITSGYGYGNILVNGYGDIPTTNASGVITAGYGYGNIIIQGYGTIPTSTVTPLTGSIIIFGLGGPHYITQGYGTSDNPNIIIDTGIIIGATNDQYTHNGNSVILSGKKYYQGLDRDSSGFGGFEDLLGRFNNYRLYPNRGTPDYQR